MDFKNGWYGKVTGQPRDHSDCPRCDLFEQRLRVLRRERELLGHEIHDGLIQQLVAAKMFLESATAALVNADPRENRPLLDSALRAINDAVEEARNILTSDHWAQLEDGLSQAIQQEMQKRLPPSGIQVIFLCSSQKPVPKTIAQTVLRIAQECLSNIARHSRATRVEVELLFHDDGLELTVCDNGAGIPELADSSLTEGNSAAGHTSFGIAGMRARAAAFGGTFDVSRSTLGGVRGHLVLPLQDPLDPL
jgi:signal transduction histidine kinase